MQGSPVIWCAVAATASVALWLFVFGRDARLRRRLARLAAGAGDIRLPADALRRAPARVRAILDRALARLVANQHLDAARLIEESVDNTDAAARAALLNLTAACYHLAGRHAAAAERYERSARLAAESGAGGVEAAAWSNLALLRIVQSEPRLALDAQERALALDRAAGNRIATATGLGRLGLVRQMLGETARALDLHLEALAIDEAAGNRRGSANTLGRLGLAYQVSGEFERALEHYRRGLALARAAGYRAGAAELLGNIGLLHLERDEFEPALASLLEALAIFGQQRDTARAVNTVSGLALVRRRMGRVEFEEACRARGIAAAELSRLSGLLNRVAARNPVGR
ncbi:MAG: tetratricopeptide repeat protein [bacterium]